MSLPEILSRMRIEIGRLQQLDLGYPIGDHRIRDPDPICADPSWFSPSVARGWKWLEPLYSACDGLRFPDVHIGYFIKTRKRLLQTDPNLEPQAVMLDRDVPVLSFGSTGGGDLFVVDCECGRILRLPPGELVAGRFQASGMPVVELAANAEGFLDRLLADVIAFVADDRSHCYM